MEDGVFSLFQPVPPVALLLALNVIGLAIKASKLPNWTIPWVLPLLGGAIYPHIAELTKVSADIRHHYSLNIVYGIAIGGAAVWGNQVIRSFRGFGPVGNQPTKPPEPPTP